MLSRTWTSRARAFVSVSSAISTVFLCSAISSGPFNQVLSRLAYFAYKTSANFTDFLFFATSCQLSYRRVVADKRKFKKFGGFILPVQPRGLPYSGRSHTHFFHLFLCERLPCAFLLRRLAKGSQLASTPYGRSRATADVCNDF